MPKTFLIIETSSNATPKIHSHYRKKRHAIKGLDEIANEHAVVDGRWVDYHGRKSISVTEISGANPVLSKFTVVKAYV